MRALPLAVALLFLVGPARAQRNPFPPAPPPPQPAEGVGDYPPFPEWPRWHAINLSDPHFVFVDVETLSVTEDGYLLAWTQWLAREPEPRALMRYRIDCAGRRMKSEAFYRRTWDGEVVPGGGSVPDSERSWTDVVPGTMGEAVLDGVCEVAPIFLRDAAF